MFLVLVFLTIIWQSVIKQTQYLQENILEIARRNAGIAQKATETAAQLTEVIKHDGGESLPL